MSFGESSRIAGPDVGQVRRCLESICVSENMVAGSRAKYYECTGSSYSPFYN